MLFCFDCFVEKNKTSASILTGLQRSINHLITYLCFMVDKIILFTTDRSDDDDEYSAGRVRYRSR